MTRSQKSESFAQAADGTRIRYLHWFGADTSKRLVLIHALAMTADFWDDTVAALGPEWQVLALDCRGHGASDKPSGPYSVELFADDVAAVMDDAGWPDAVIAGASMGGCVSLAFVAGHRDRVTGLGLIDTTASYGENAIEAWEERGQKAIDGGMGALIGFQKTRWFSDGFREANEAVLERAIGLFTANDPEAYLETCRMLGKCDMRAALASIECPTEVLVGEEDYATPVAMAEALTEAIKSANLQIVPGVRHLTPLEIPGTVANAIASL